MSDVRLTDRILRHDRRIVAAALFLSVVVAAGFILAGSGTGMSAIGMTAHTGPAGALIAGTPDVVSPMLWTPRYALVIFVMWWLMMVAMRAPRAAPTILLYGALTVLVAKGYVQASDIEPVIGALLTIGSVIWSVSDKRWR